MYEILRLKATDRSNAEEYKSYRLSVKNRLNGPYQVRVLKYVSKLILGMTINVILIVHYCSIRIYVAINSDLVDNKCYIRMISSCV